MTTLQTEPMTDREWTFIVRSGADPVGYIRHDPSSGNWVARTTGNAHCAADVRRFLTESACLTWLAGAVNGVRLRASRRRKAVSA